MAKSNAGSLRLALTAAQGRKDAGTSADVSLSPADVRRPSKAKDPNYSTLSVYIPRDLHVRAKLASIEDRRELSEVVEGLVTDWLAKRKA